MASLKKKRKSLTSPRAEGVREQRDGSLEVDVVEEPSAAPADREEGFDPTAALDDYLRACVRIDPLDLNKEYTRVSADLAYWNQQYADALRHYLLSEIEYKRTKSSLEPVIRAELIAVNGKTTIPEVKAAIEADDRVLDAQRVHAEAEVEKARIYGNLDAIRSKKEMLISLGAHVRAEMEGDPLIRDQHRMARASIPD